MVHLGNRDIESCPGRSFYGIVRYGRSSIFWNDDTVYPTTFGRSDNGAKIPDIGYLVQKQKKWTFFFGNDLFYKLLKIFEGNWGNLRYHALMVVAGKTVQFLDGHIRCTDAIFSNRGFQLFEKLSFKALLQEYLVDGLFGFYGFNYCPYAINVLVVLHAGKSR